MEERRCLGLCFNCNEKFGRDHNRVCQRLFLIDLAEAEDNDTTDDSATAPIILVLSISGVRTRETMQFRITIGSALFLALLDSSSSHNFITEEAAACTNIVLAP
jgi:hypothetical protein